MNPMLYTGSFAFLVMVAASLASGLVVARVLLARASTHPSISPYAR